MIHFPKLIIEVLSEATAKDDLGPKTREYQATLAGIGETVTQTSAMAKNVLGGELAICSNEPLTGWTRNGCCETDDRDFGSHTVCAIVDERFLRYSAAVGNDLSTPGPSFDGLKPGDRWCLCASRWRDAYRDGMAPPVVLEACHERALDVIDLEILKAHAAKP